MMIISIIPMIMYQIYISTKNNNKNNMVYWIGIGAYGVYIFSQLLVLSFSRIREYYADHFAKTVTNGTDLANALVKIAYGFTEIEKSKKPKVSSMAFTNNIQNEAFAMVQYKQMDMNELEEKLMKWDIQNIWGKFYEFWSTHPLTFKRILALKGKKIEKENNSAVYSIRFCIEAFISVLPWMTAGIILFIYESELASGFKMIDGGLEIIHNHPLSLVVLGISALIKYYYCYGNTFKQQSIYELLLRQDASPIKGIPAILEGKAIGKGIPGLFYSEDIVIDDETGILFIDYRLPLKILEFFFGMMKVDELKDRNVKVSGWYRRGIRPYFVCKHIIVGEEKIISYNYLLKQLLGYGLMIAGMIMWLF
jgi:heat shock protein HtpX